MSGRCQWNVAVPFVAGLASCKSYQGRFNVWCGLVGLTRGFILCYAALEGINQYRLDIIFCEILNFLCIICYCVNTERAQWVKIRPHGRQRPVCHMLLILLLLMTHYIHSHSINLVCLEYSSFCPRGVVIYIQYKQYNWRSQITIALSSS